MLHAPGDDEQLTLVEHDRSVSQLDLELALQDEEEVVGLGVAVPDKLALRLDDHHLVVVQRRHRSRRPVVGEESELLAQVDLVSPPAWTPTGRSATGRSDCPRCRRPWRTI